MRDDTKSTAESATGRYVDRRQVFESGIPADFRTTIYTISPRTGNANTVVRISLVPCCAES